MAVVLRILSLDLPETIKHLATDWEVSKDLLFKDIVLSSYGDTINKTTIVFDYNLDAGIKYYARARSLLDTTGYTIWGNIDIFKPKDINDVSLDVDLPTAVGLPILTTNSDKLLHRCSFFKILASNFSVIGNSKHCSTSWLIEDIFGNVIWKRYEDTINKLSIHISEPILKNNMVYVLRAVFNTTSNDSSQVATYIIKTGTNLYTKVVSPLSNIKNTEDIKIKLFKNNLINNIEYRIWYINNGAHSLVKQETLVNEFEIKLTAGTLLDNKQYILEIKSDLDDTYNYYPFSTY